MAQCLFTVITKLALFTLISWLREQHQIDMVSGKCIWSLLLSIIVSLFGLWCMKSALWSLMNVLLYLYFV